VTQIDASRFDPGTAYISVSRFRVDDLTPLVFRTHDGGRTWTKITRGLADNASVNVVRADPLTKGLLFAGTERDVYVSFNDGDDYHTIWINPNNPDIILIAADQGATITVNRGQTWSLWYNQPTAQMFHVTADNRFSPTGCTAASRRADRPASSAGATTARSRFASGAPSASRSTATRRPIRGTRASSSAAR